MTHLNNKILKITRKLNQMFGSKNVRIKSQVTSPEVVTMFSIDHNSEELKVIHFNSDDTIILDWSNEQTNYTFDNQISIVPDIIKVEKYQILVMQEN